MTSLISTMLFAGGANLLQKGAIFLGYEYGFRDDLTGRSEKILIARSAANEYLSDLTACVGSQDEIGRLQEAVSSRLRQGECVAEVLTVIRTWKLAHYRESAHDDAVYYAEPSYEHLQTLSMREFFQLGVAAQEPAKT